MNKHVKEIITDKSKLEDWCIEIDPQKDGKLTQEIVLALKGTMRENNLCYLSAPQIGYNYRVICIRFGERDYRTFINPVIENNVDMSFVRETCCSYPDREFVMPRFNKVKFYFTTPMSKVECATLQGHAAHILQHAIEHLNGVLVDDIGLEIDDMFNTASEEEQQEVLKMYAESLDLRQKELERIIEENEELKQVNEAINFMNSVRDGTTILENKHQEEK